MTNWQTFATIDPFSGMTGDSPGVLRNLVGGGWADADRVRDDIIDPLNGERFLAVPDTEDLTPFIDGLRSCPKSGLHNPLKNNDRYVYLGRVCAKAAQMLADPDVEAYFTRLIQRVMPNFCTSFRKPLVRLKIRMAKITNS